MFNALLTKEKNTECNFYGTILLKILPFKSNKMSLFLQKNTLKIVKHSKQFYLHLTYLSLDLFTLFYLYFIKSSFSSIKNASETSYDFIAYYQEEKMLYTLVSV